MLHPVASSGPAGAGGPVSSPMNVVTSPSLVPRAVEVALNALGIQKIRSTTTGTFVGKPSEIDIMLGEGGLSKVYQGIEANADGKILGIIALSKSIKKTLPIDFISLLDSVPASPYILARPTLVPGDKHVRLRMDLLPETGDLINHINSLASDLDKWTTLISGMVNVTKALKAFHDCGITHRDCTLENSCATGLFDHGTICKSGEFSPFMGASLEFLPQEILQTVLNQISPSNELWFSISDILAGRGNTHTGLPQAEFDPKEPTLKLKYTCAVDVFILGSQFHRVLCSLKNPRQFFQPFITQMIHPDPLKRPSISEIIPILEDYQLVLASLVS